MHGVDAAQAGRTSAARGRRCTGLGISTAIADKALSHYDGIRRALGH
jgi:hypothetical protein